MDPSFGGGGRRLIAISLALAAGGVAFAATWSAVMAANPSSFTDSLAGYNWSASSRILSTVGQTWTFESNPSSPLEYCWLHGQWINAGGTYHTEFGQWYDCGAPAYKQYSNASQTELYAEHNVKFWVLTDTLRSTDAYCGGSPC